MAPDDNNRHGAGSPPAADSPATQRPFQAAAYDPQPFRFPDDSDDDYLEDEAGPLDEDAALATLPPLTEEDRHLIDKLVHSMRLLDIGISSPAAHEAVPPSSGAFPSLKEGPASIPGSAVPQPPTRPVVPPRPAVSAQDEENIPMLTDVVNVQRYHPDQLPQNFEDVDWSELAGQVQENVLERLLRRGDILLDAQINNALNPLISRAIETMTRDMHDTLNRVIRDIVARAVTEEITRLHAEMARQQHSR